MQRKASDLQKQQIDISNPRTYIQDKNGSSALFSVPEKLMLQSKQWQWLDLEGVVGKKGNIALDLEGEMSRDVQSHQILNAAPRKSRTGHVASLTSAQNIGK